MRLRAGLPVLWRGPTVVQVGTDPRWAVTLTDLSPSAATALRALAPAADVADLRSAFAREHVSAEADPVLAHLATAHLLVADPMPDPRRPDAIAWGVVAHDGDGDGCVAARAGSVVRLVGLGRVGGGIAAHLAAAGVGTVELEDGRNVDRHDVGPGGLTPRDVGTSRAAATARLLHDMAPGIRTGAATRRRADLVVLVEHGVADPLRHRDLLDHDVAHLSVVVREASVLVGPLVTAGRSSCLRCVDLHRGDNDPGWPAVAAQLVVGREEHVVETTVAATASALAATQVLAHLDGRPTSVRDASLEIRLPEVVPRLVRWSAHPDCDCAGPPRHRPQEPS